MTSYRDLAIAAMDNHRLAYEMRQLAGSSISQDYWAEVQRQAQRELHVYLNWMIYHPARPTLSEGGQSR